MVHLWFIYSMEMEANSQMISSNCLFRQCNTSCLSHALLPIENGSFLEVLF
jgi:hypothetical protein